MTDRHISLDAAIETIRKLPPMWSSFDAIEALSALPDVGDAPEPVAMRHSFDGFGYLYIDSGSGSDWRTRHPDAEPLYAPPEIE